MKFSVFLLSICISVTFGFTIHAQSVVSHTFPTTGAAFSNSENSVHFSIGETINTFLNEGDLRLSQGLIQHLLSELPIGINSFQLEGISVYPNPTTDFIIVENKQALQNLQYALYNIEGKEIKAAQTLSQLKTTLNMETLPVGNYLLKISKDDLHFQNLNLIKN